MISLDLDFLTLFQVSMGFWHYSLAEIPQFSFSENKNTSSFATFLSRLTLNLLSLCNHSTKISFTILVVTLVTGSFGTPGSVGIFSKLLKFDLTDDLLLDSMDDSNVGSEQQLTCECVSSVLLPV